MNVHKNSATPLILGVWLFWGSFLLSMDYSKLSKLDLFDSSPAREAAVVAKVTAISTSSIQEKVAFFKDLPEEKKVLVQGLQEEWAQNSMEKKDFLDAANEIRELGQTQGGIKLLDKVFFGTASPAELASLKNANAVRICLLSVIATVHIFSE